MPTHTTLKGVGHISDPLVSDQLEANVIAFVQWGFLGVGGFFTNRRGDDSCYGATDNSRLRPVTDPNYTDGQVWEGFRKDWVWESGVEYSTQPIRVSGVWVDGAFVPQGSSVAVDYPNGRVVFAEPRSQTGVVQAEHSYRLFQVYSCDSPAWAQMQPGSFRNDDEHFLQVGSGTWDVLAQNRVQLPAVFVEAVPNARRYGRQVGGGEWVNQDVLFHVFTEERFHMKWLHDALVAQKDKTIRGFDKGRLLTDDAFPVDAWGAPRASGLMYPDLVKSSGEGGYYWDDITFKDTRGVEQPPFGDFWYCSVRALMEVATGV